MARRTFYSFHYAVDAARAGQVRNMGVVDGTEPASDNDWETVKRGGDAAIERWIANQMHGTSCIVVLIGAETASRKWVRHEIVTGWNAGKGVLGVRIHGLKNLAGEQGIRGANPFAAIKCGAGTLADHVPILEPPYSDSRQCYAHIKTNLANAIEQAIQVRAA